jgi:hypothetical protein
MTVEVATVTAKIHHSGGTLDYLSEYLLDTEWKHVLPIRICVASLPHSSQRGSQKHSKNLSHCQRSCSIHLLSVNELERYAAKYE